MIDPERIQPLNSLPDRSGDYVAYWMQASQRAEYNHALEFAVREANNRKQPLLVVFGVTPDYPEANLRHYTFMLEGLRETQEALKDRGIRMVVSRQSPDKAALGVAEHASLLVADRGYLRFQVDWRHRVAEDAPCPVVQVESDVIVPVETASPKEEYAAATIRPKIHKHVEHFLKSVRSSRVKRDSLGLKVNGWSIDNVEAALSELRVDRGVGPVTAFEAGTAEARKRLDAFISNRLDDYPEQRNHPELDAVSHMSPYLHFGQISPLQIALKVERAGGKSREAKDDYLEELIVRRELSMNFVYYNWDYDAYTSLPDWARKTLEAHKKDKRDPIYKTEAFEAAETNDPYWNAAQKEMVLTGKMHNYMRMYWGKKILEWSASPEEAFKTALYLNNKYELDGRDPNSFAGVAWCFGKHDRPWTERKIFGKVRYMNDNGLRRKFDMDAYLAKVEALQAP